MQLGFMDKNATVKNVFFAWASFFLTVNKSIQDSQHWNIVLVKLTNLKDEYFVWLKYHPKMF